MRSQLRYRPGWDYYIQTPALCKADFCREKERFLRKNRGEKEKILPEKLLLRNWKEYSKMYLTMFRFDAEQGRTNWGDSGALYPQSATAGMNPDPRTCDVSSDLDKQR